MHGFPQRHNEKSVRYAYEDCKNEVSVCDDQKIPLGRLARGNPKEAARFLQKLGNLRYNSQLQNFLFRRQ